MENREVLKVFTWLLKKHWIFHFFIPVSPSKQLSTQTSCPAKHTWDINRHGIRKRHLKKQKNENIDTGSFIPTFVN